MWVKEIVDLLQNYELTHFDQDNISTKITSKVFEKSIAFSNKHNEFNDTDNSDNYDLEAMDLF